MKRLELPLRNKNLSWQSNPSLLVLAVGLVFLELLRWRAFRSLPLVSVAIPVVVVLMIARKAYRYYQVSQSPFAVGRRGGKEVVLAEDGVQTPETFVPWAKVRDLREYEDGAAIVTTSGDLVVVRAEDTLEFLSEAKRFRAAGSARVAVRVEAMEWLDGETSGQREERLLRYFGAGDASYREGRGEPRDLAELAADPAASPGQRVQAARLLVRVEPSLVLRVREAAQETANAELSEALLLAVGEN